MFYHHQKLLMIEVWFEYSFQLYNLSTAIKNSHHDALE